MVAVLAGLVGVAPRGAAQDAPVSTACDDAATALTALGEGIAQLVTDRDDSASSLEVLQELKRSIARGDDVRALARSAVRALKQTLAGEKRSVASLQRAFEKIGAALEDACGGVPAPASVSRSGSGAGDASGAELGCEELGVAQEALDASNVRLANLDAVLPAIVDTEIAVITLRDEELIGRGVSRSIVRTLDGGFENVLWTYDKERRTSANLEAFVTVLGASLECEGSEEPDEPDEPDVDQTVTLDASYSKDGPDTTVFACIGTDPELAGADYDLVISGPDDFEFETSGVLDEGGTAQVGTPVDKNGDYDLEVTVYTEDDEITESTSVHVSGQPSDGGC
jgi:hypothetical protein